MSAAENELHELDEAGAPKIASASSESELDEVVCRREREAGSNFYTKTCFRRSQIEARSEEDQEALRRMRRIRSGTQSETNPGN
ncbi:MAG: hypothetical protein KJO80_14915 [Gammaproteobacteria bacterium]|nr:hypothetical protein [Gammaproteobacteria bacterium]